MIAARSTRIALLFILILTACSCATRSSLNTKRGYGPVKPASLSDYIRAVYKLSTETSGEAERRAEVLAQQPQLAELLARADQNPGDAALRSELIAAYMNHKLFREAYELLMESHVADSGDSEINLNLARVWDAWGQYDLALQYAERGISTAKPNAQAFELVGRIHLHGSRPGEAATWFTRALQEDRLNASVLTNLGYARMLQSEWEQARLHLEEALKVDADVTEAHNNLAIVLSRLGDERGALSHLMTTGTPAVAFNNMGVLYLQQNKFEEAQRSFQEALRLEPQYELAHRNLQAIQTATPPPAIIHISSFSAPVAIANSQEPDMPVTTMTDTVASELPVTDALRTTDVADFGDSAAGIVRIEDMPRIPVPDVAPKVAPEIVKPSHRAETAAGETLEQIVRLEHRGLNIAGLAGAFILTGLFALRPRKSGL
jgi:tetratricopeptide (TPR) repeat protein